MNEGIELRTLNVKTQLAADTPLAEATVRMNRAAKDNP
jgi:hypothetical protein